MAKAEDILPANTDHLEIDGKLLRKGSISAALKNVETLQKRGMEFESVEGKDLLKISKEVLLPLGFYEHLSWKNPKVQRKLQEEIGIKRIEEKEVSFTPSLKPTKANMQVWDELIEFLEDQRYAHPNNSSIVKAIMLLKFHKDNICDGTTSFCKINKS